LSGISVLEAPAEEESPVAVVSHGRQVLRKLYRNTPAMVGLGMVLLIIVMAVLAPLVSRYDPNAVPNDFSLSLLNQGPSPAHWMGTDYLGRDMWARLIYGARISLPAGLQAVFISFVIGVPMGVIAGYGHKLLDDALMRFVDMLLAFPGLLLAISIVTFLGPSLQSVIIAIGIAGIPGYARVARGLTLQARAETYILAAQALGVRSIRIMRRHVLPNIIGPLVVLATLNLSGAILATAGLSFLGLGTQPPTADWGTMLYKGYTNMFLSWAGLIFPAMFLVFTVLGINMLGDGLAEALSPGQSRGGR
jgi:ABC-type dipeptide/oligopeptide/nickel transport system permease subunit